MRHLMRFLGDYRKECVIAPAFKCLEALLDLLVPLVMADMINVGIPAGDTAYLLRRSGLLVLLGAVGLAFSIMAQYFAAKAAAGFGASVRRALFQKSQTLSRRRVDEVGSATLITRMTSDVNQVQNGVNLSLRLFLRSPFIVFGALILAFTIDVRSGWIFAAVIAVLCLVVFGIMAFTIPGYRGVQFRLDNIMHHTRENLTGVRVVRAFRREGDETADFRRANADLRGAQLRVGRVSALMNPMTYVVVNLGVAAVLATGAVSIDAGGLLRGDVIALINYLSQILVELIKMANMVVILTRTLASGSRISAVLDLADEETDGGADVTVEGEVAVAFRDAGITYPDAGAESLSHVTFSVLRGQTVGVIGGTGSGKTTLVNLIPRLYDCTSGRVEVFGRDVREYDASQLRRAVGMVPQKARMFSGTVRSNLCFGKADATDDELWQALELARAADFVRALPLGLDAPVEQGGRNFSGGQRQRLTIARALVTHPAILILDDSASALDYATDAALRRSLRALPDSPTIFWVTQRVTSLRSADLILMLDDGAVLDMGTHEELLSRCGAYREICESQFSAGDDGP